MKDAQNRYCGRIPPVAKELNRPLWSVMIPTYNCDAYLREALAGVLVQDPGPHAMQIEVVDDCSNSHDPETVVGDLGGGRVGFYRQSRNVGHVKNFQTCLERSRGKLIHLLHGDDCVRDGFYQRMGRLFDLHPEIGAAFCRHAVVDERGNVQRISPLEQAESGVLKNWLERIACELVAQPPSVIVRREVYENLGGFDCRMLSCGEDWEMLVRIAVHYPVGYEPELLAWYRDNSNSLTKRSVRSGQNIRDVRKATEIVGVYLPKSISRDASKRAGENWAKWALHWAGRLVAAGDTVAAVTQLREGFMCSHSRGVMKLAAPMVIRIGKLWLRRLVHWNTLFKQRVV